MAAFCRVYDYITSGLTCLNWKSNQSLQSFSDKKLCYRTFFWFNVQMRMKQTIIQPTTYQTLLFVEAGKLLQIFITLFHCHLVIQLGQNWSPVIKESSKTTLNAAWYSLHQHNNSMQYWCKRVRKNQYLARHDKTGCQWQHKKLSLDIVNWLQNTGWCILK